MIKRMEPVTKADLDALRTDLDASFRRDLDTLRIELTNDLTEKMRGIETTLLKEFRKWAVPMNTRTRVFEATTQGLTERLSLVEERLDALETGCR